MSGIVRLSAWTMLVSCVLFCSFSGSVVTAASFSVDNFNTDLLLRELSVDIRPEHIEVLSISRLQRSDTAWKFLLDTVGGLRFRLEELDGGPDSTEATARWEVRLDRLIWYLNIGDEPGYQPDVDQVNRTTLLHSGQAWTRFSCENRLDTDHTLFCEVRARVEDAGELLVTIYLGEQLFHVNGTAFLPNSLKFDLQLVSQGFKELPAIGLELRSLAEAEHLSVQQGSIRLDEGLTERPENCVNFADHGYFSWVTTATRTSLNGTAEQDVQVFASSLTESDAMRYPNAEEALVNVRKRLWLSFSDVEGHARYMLDPTLGSPASTALPSLFAALSLLLLALLS